MTAHSPSLWDPIVRLSHWGLAVVVIANALVTRGGGVTHLWLGWLGMGLLGMRLIWGMIGAPEACFTAFPPNPLAALRHLGALLRGAPAGYASHNPAGAMMAYMMWAGLILVIVTGLTMNHTQPWQAAKQADILANGDWGDLDAASSQSEGGGIIKDIHEMAANLMLALAVLHVAGVIIEGRAMRRNLIAPMLLGETKGRAKP